MSNHLWLKLVFGVALMTMAACSGGGSGGDDDDDDDDDDDRNIQEMIGGNFAAIFNRDSNSEPVDPKPGDLPPVSLTDDPIDF